MHIFINGYIYISLYTDFYKYMNPNMYSKTNLDLCINSNSLYINQYRNINLYTNISIHIHSYLYMKTDMGLINITLCRMTINLY